MSGKKIVDAKNDSKGNVNAIKLEGNSSFTPLATAIKMTERGQINAVVVKPKNGNEYIRTKPDGKKKNNLDNLAK
ncbi:DUF3892 domain-containing protein [Pseudoalteromonas sp. S558]|uniref:DUF3892 domain-containing protein n=1 Tax=Pseudoalteromonas sp. S558 TaxID=2066515 RepID=UPI00110B62B0|nr:DUF3892 domain-containing protein [Pseudoalteromonas sp. S558]TMO02912.1 DUF3892 domain-containing protein [Pseudoalteromonas sp. S558]